MNISIPSLDAIHTVSTRFSGYLLMIIGALQIVNDYCYGGCNLLSPNLAALQPHGYALVLAGSGLAGLGHHAEAQTTAAKASVPLAPKPGG